jgi:hypothetical protein
VRAEQARHHDVGVQHPNGRAHFEGRWRRVLRAFAISR